MTEKISNSNKTHLFGKQEVRSGVASKFRHMLVAMIMAILTHNLKTGRGY
jgi:hypothetical protein